MQIDELQHRLAVLRPGETLILPPENFEGAFVYYRARDVRRIAAIELGRLYSCSVRFCSLERDEVVFTRSDRTDVLSSDETAAMMPESKRNPWLMYKPVRSEGPAK